MTRRFFTREKITAKTRGRLEEWKRLWGNATQFSELPATGYIAILRHRWPATVISRDNFIKGHLTRVQKQYGIATSRSPNPALAHVQAVALPIIAGFDDARREFVTVMEFKNPSKQLTMKSQWNINYAALERALCKVWSFGYQFEDLDLRTIFISPQFEVTLYDISRLVGPTRYVARQFATATPGNTLVRFENFYASGGDAQFLQDKYNKLGSLNKPTDRDALIDQARYKLWNLKKNLS